LERCAKEGGKVKIVEGTRGFDGDGGHRSHHVRKKRGGGVGVWLRGDRNSTGIGKVVRRAGEQWGIPQGESGVERQDSQTREVNQ